MVDHSPHTSIVRQPSDQSDQPLAEDLPSAGLITRADLDAQLSWRTGHRRIMVVTTVLPPFMENKNDIYNELNHTEIVWRKYRERQRAFEIRQAMQGATADPSISIELEEIKTHMTELSQRYNVLSEMLNRLEKKDSGTDLSSKEVA